MGNSTPQISSIQKSDVLKYIIDLNMNTPVAVVFFNRITPLRKLLARLSEVHPSKLYLISDGPRDGREGEGAKVAECRKFMQDVPWTCEIKTNFAETNLGCRRRVTSGLDWVFQQEERAIILEDDCIPTVEFFSWIEKMLDLYENDNSVMSICGTNYNENLSDEKFDIVATKYPVFTGWGTWRRAWQLNDKNLSLLSKAKECHQLRKWLGSGREEYYWLYLLSHVKSSWGYRWSFTNFMYEALQVLPSRNLIENVGINSGPATHTSDYLHVFPSVHDDWRYKGRIPERLVSNIKLDQWFADVFYSKSFSERVKWLVKKIQRKVCVK